MHTELNRREVLKTIGGAGLAAVFGARALDFLGEDAQAGCQVVQRAADLPVPCGQRCRERLQAGQRCEDGVLVRVQVVQRRADLHEQ